MAGFDRFVLSDQEGNELTCPLGVVLAAVPFLAATLLKRAARVSADRTRDYARAADGELAGLAAETARLAAVVGLPASFFDDLRVVAGSRFGFEPEVFSALLTSISAAEESRAALTAPAAD